MGPAMGIHDLLLLCALNMTCSLRQDHQSFCMNEAEINLPLLRLLPGYLLCNCDFISLLLWGMALVIFAILTHVCITFMALSMVINDP